MKLTIPATVVCLIPWVILGLPLNFDWFTAFGVCIAIDLAFYFKNKEKHEED